MNEYVCAVVGVAALWLIVVSGVCFFDLMLSYGDALARKIASLSFFFFDFKIASFSDDLYIGILVKHILWMLPLSSAHSGNGIKMETGAAYLVKLPLSSA